MKTSVASLTFASIAFASGAFVAPVLILLADTGPAAAASPAYCALYAREYASARIGAPVTGEDASALQRIEDQAYYRCLNQDEAPQFPTTSAYFNAPLDDITGAGTGADGPFQALQIHPKGKAVAPPAIATVTDSPSPAVDGSGGAADGSGDASGAVADSKATKPVRVAEATSGRGHGAPGSAQWASWCHAHYRSFDEATGYVLTFSGEKKACP